MVVKDRPYGIRVARLSVVAYFGRAAYSVTPDVDGRIVIDPLDSRPCMAYCMGMKTTATVKSFEAMVDGSGAPAVISVGEHTFSCDCIGEVKITSIGTPAAWRSRGSKAAAVNVARAAYRRLLDGLSAEWHAANRAMYAA